MMNSAEIANIASWAVLANNNIDALALFERAGEVAADDLKSAILLNAIKAQGTIVELTSEQVEHFANTAPWLLAFYASSLRQAKRTRHTASMVQACKSGMARYVEALKSEIQRGVSRGKRIIVGPWTGEVGYEILYWMPFCRALLDSQEFRDATIIVTRGGVGAYYWAGANEYDYFSDTNIQLGDLVTEKEKIFRSQKQLAETKRERLLLEHMGIDERTDIQLHPKHMFLLFAPFFNAHTSDLFSRDSLLPYLRPVNLVTPAASRAKDGYCYIDIYERPSFKPTDGNAAEIVAKMNSWASLSGAYPYRSVKLSSSVDEHNAYDLYDSISIESEEIGIVGNLRRKVELIRNASNAVMTYGGLAYIAYAANVPVLTLRTTDRFIMKEHEALATMLYPHATKLHVSIGAEAHQA